MTPDAGRCLNCGAEIRGAFCAACGQRSVPPNPTVAELAGDAWQELSGYDGRIAATFRNLIHPGRLTIDYLAGRRARYLPPVRLYLIASLIYFVVAAAAPSASNQNPAEVRGPGSLRIGLWDDTRDPTLSEEDRAELKKNAAEAVWPIRVLLEAIERDPAAFRARLFTIMPRVFFGMLPVFAGIVWLFYRGRRFPTALVFAAHVHAFAFLLFSITEALKFARSEIVSAIVGVPLVIGFLIYVLRAFRKVFGGGWPKTIAKAAGIGFMYLLTSIPAFFIILVWASLT
jgi:uncharacterized protein DUF3667